MLLRSFQPIGHDGSSVRARELWAYDRDVHFITGRIYVTYLLDLLRGSMYSRSAFKQCEDDSRISMGLGLTDIMADSSSPTRTPEKQQS